MWKYCQVIMKSYSNYKPKLDHRYEWLKAVQVWSSVNHPNIAKVVLSISLLSIRFMAVVLVKEEISLFLLNTVLDL